MYTFMVVSPKGKKIYAFEFPPMAWSRPLAGCFIFEKHSGYVESSTRVGLSNAH